MIVRVDYTYDTSNFFDTQQKRDAIEAAAARFSRVIDSPLGAVSPDTWRIGFTHPTTGASYQVSTAANAAADPLLAFDVPAANTYGFGGLVANEWILYVGGRSLPGAGEAGTGTGTNFTSTFNDVNGPHHRGLIPNTPSNTVQDLPVWGGSASFDNDGSTTWHFDLNTAAPFGSADFYSIALHEIGHALGLNTTWNQWTEDQVGRTYFGAETVAAYNEDNASAVSGLTLEDDNPHFLDGEYDSEIFLAGQPNLVGTVGEGTLQDLLMEPIANFVFPDVRRFEITNVDAAALRDVGWSTIAAIPEASPVLVFGLLAAAPALRRRGRAA